VNGENITQKRETELAHGQSAKWNQVRDARNKLTDVEDAKGRHKTFLQSNIFGQDFDKDPEIFRQDSDDEKEDE
jgi:hypothetical protein